MTEGSRHVPCVGGILFDADGRLLLIRRGNEPGRGLWSVPGGRVESGEDDHTALVREMAEETGLSVSVGPLVGSVERGRYRIADYLCSVEHPDGAAGSLRAGDDATDARFVDAAAFAALPLVEGLTETLDGWGVLPRI
ncbi:ADP-ribose pyrophosphatase YjhB (NUDIX family) [Pseudonocardia sediminis]|uniref:ADP-ribose pyrophosphatase YjhB (NUDIX family) n=1 Tax=Pseudonocardia sediminis TaxID=1397368 RepID=A0A4V2FQB3_PSEST|nr:NUDIX domain-containing protein [Pseudonocardia sediminis]RZT84100.1 ADP-ribose pyrophosphatase YjhB (NUDIX family) [Pseudonocardia sediminis]